MTGTLSSIPLNQQFDINGQPLSGARLMIYLANTTTQATTYRTYALTPGQEHAWPIITDIYGRVPMFWMADGLYRARLEDKYGKIIFDEPQLPTVQIPVSGGPTEVVENPAWNTGDIMWQPLNVSRAGWVRANARTIGDNLSGASERAHPTDTRALFSWLYTNFDNTRCPVSSGRGASASADFDAHKTIQLLDMRGFGVCGLDGMGNTVSTRLGPVIPLHAGGFDIGGSLIGHSYHQLAIAEMPQHNHPGSSASDSGHTHPYKDRYTDIYAQHIGGATAQWTHQDHDRTTDTGYANITLTVANQGASAYHNNTPFVMLGAWFLRL